MRLAWGVIAVLLTLWIPGIILHVGGIPIRLVVFLAVVVFIFDLFKGRHLA
jgi:hypothetical protein